MFGRDVKTCVLDTGGEGRAARIRILNDALRCYAHSGVICITAGVQALGERGVEVVLMAVRDFDAFDDRNDPHAEHDFGAFNAAGARLFFKIDYYDRDRRYGSPDPVTSVNEV